MEMTYLVTKVKLLFFLDYKHTCIYLLFTNEISFSFDKNIRDLNSCFTLECEELFVCKVEEHVYPRMGVSVS